MFSFEWQGDTQIQAFFGHFHLKPYPNHCGALPNTLALITLLYIMELGEK